MKINLVTAFPPSHERLNEYGYHVARELQRYPYLSVTVLADEIDGRAAELPGFEVIRCWRPNSFHNPIRLLRTVRQLKPDVVWYNLVFSSFGTNPAAAFAGLCAPAMTRAVGYSTHVTLHQLMEGVNLRDAGVRFPDLYRMFGRLATQCLLQANSVNVLLPKYLHILRQQYRSRNVFLRPHGTFGQTSLPQEVSRNTVAPRLLAFGKWGTYKKLDVLLKIFPDIVRAVPGCRLIIAGEDHPAAPGYLASLRERYDWKSIDFRNYVAEDQIPELLASASMMVMPYISATGSSGVAHQACQFGLPIVCADIPDFREMATEEGIAMAFYRVGDGAELASTIIALLQDPGRQRQMAQQNYSAAARNMMPEIVSRYLRHFSWDHRARMFTAGSRVWPRRPKHSVLTIAGLPSASELHYVPPEDSLGSHESPSRQKALEGHAADTGYSNPRKPDSGLLAGD